MIFSPFFFSATPPQLSQYALGQSEIGTFVESLSQIQIALETTAHAHLDLSQQISMHLENPLTRFVDEQRDVWKAVSIVRVFLGMGGG